MGGVPTHRAHLQRLIEVSGLRRVRLQILPQSVGAHAAMDGGFQVLDFLDPGEPSVVYLATTTGDLFLEDGEVSLYRLRVEALTPTSPTRSGSSRA